MRVISQKKLREFWSDHQDAEEPLRAWYKTATRADWRDFGEVRRTCSNSVDRVGNCTVFNIGGNKYRLVASIKFQTRKIFLLHALTHKEYDIGRWKRDC